MRVLLKHIERGLDDKPNPVPLAIIDGEENDQGLGYGEGQGQGEEGGSWRISVHALNVIRMILVDAALSPDLDTFIAESTQLAVRGFQSRNWAVSWLHLLLSSSLKMIFTSWMDEFCDNFIYFLLPVLVLSLSSTDTYVHYSVPFAGSELFYDGFFLRGAESCRQR